MNLSCTILSFSALSSQTLLSCPALFSLLQDSPLSSCNLLSPPSLASLLLHSPLFSLLLDYPFSSFTLLSLSPPALSFLLLHSLLYFLILYSPLFTLLFTTAVFRPACFTKILCRRIPLFEAATSVNSSSQYKYKQLQIFFLFSDTVSH